MRLVRYRYNDRPQWGFLESDSVVPSPGIGLREALRGGAQTLNRIWRRARQLGRLLPCSDIALLLPIPRPSKIICVGLNYHEHARESGFALPNQPITFAKYSSAIVGPHDPIQIPLATMKVAWEVELAVVIGRPGRDIRSSRILDHIAGYTILNDVYARDVQEREGQWSRAKSFDSFCPVGPNLTTVDELGLADGLNIGLDINGQLKQKGNTSDLVYGVADLVSFCSRSVTLFTGDIIATGTPSGVGISRRPPEVLRGGDIVTCKVEGIGVLRNPVLEADDAS